MIALLLLGPALAGDAEIATVLVRVALTEETPGDAPAVDADAPARLRAELDALIRAHPAADVQAAWTRRFPTASDFDARAERSWRAFGADPTPIAGLDPVGLPTVPRLERFATAAADPWRDHRHQKRLALGPDGQPRVGPDGRPVPDDPAAENVRGLDDDPDEHAFVAYPQPKQLTGDPWAAQNQAWRYAPPRWWPDGPMLALASTHAQTSTDLALLSALSEDPVVRALGELHLGQALAYVASVAMPTNTVWFGTPDFEDDASLRWWVRGTVTAGGLLGPLAPAEQIRGRIAASHRELALRLTEQHLLAAAHEGADPVGASMRQRLIEGDLLMSKRLWSRYTEGGRAAFDGPFGEVAVDFVAAENVTDAPLLLGLLREVADPALRTGEVLDVAPYGALRDDADPAVQTALWEAVDRGFRRGGVTIRSITGLWRRFNEVVRTPAQKRAAREAIADRLVRRLDTLRTDADARRAKWEAHPPAPPATTEVVWAFPATFVGAPLLVFAIVGLFLIAARSAKRVSD